MACPFCFGEGTVADPEASAECFWWYVEMPCPACDGTGDISNVPIWGYG